MRSIFLCLVVCLTTAAHAQLLGKALQKVTGNASSLIIKEPITTSFKDVKQDGAKPADFTPREPLRNMNVLTRTTNGGFVLQPGYYSYQSQSYCLKAGTKGPSTGAGYMYAPPMGTADDAVMAIVRNSVSHPNIQQHDIQVLLWAIIAHAKFENMQPGYKLTAALLLTPKQIALLNRTAMDFVPSSARANLPQPLQMALEAENKLRAMMYSANTTFAEMESVAVLAGLVDKDDIESGRWSLHPDGYYVRYLPYTYSSTQVEVYVPQGSEAVGKEFDPATHIAVPASTGRQRLIQSGRFQQTQ